jgi:8-oxo-dGTP pyrophosphatase MutT (NUDIX family)
MTQLDTLAKKLKYRLALPLPGLEAQLRMAHAERRKNIVHSKIPADANIGAVLILLFEEDLKIKTVLIQRATYDGVHSGQVAFPGGRKEEEETLEETALREAREEVDVIAEDVTIVGKLTQLYIPPSNFLVQPFVATVGYAPSFLPQADEVEGIITVSIDELFDPSKISEKEITLSNGFRVRTPVYEIAGKTIWGATAMMISELGQIIHEL